MGQYNLNRIFQPRHVAVVGASEKKGTIGNALMKNLVDGGFSGTLLPINPKYGTLYGHECFASVSSIKFGLDLVIIATPIHTVADIVQECVEKKAGGGHYYFGWGKRNRDRGPQDRRKNSKDCI